MGSQSTHIPPLPLPLIHHMGSSPTARPAPYQQHSINIGLVAGQGPTKAYLPTAHLGLISHVRDQAWALTAQASSTILLGVDSWVIISRL